MRGRALGRMRRVAQIALAVLVLAPATVIGGYVGARLASRLPAATLRAVIVVVGTIVGLVLLFRAF